MPPSVEFESTQRSGQVQRFARRLPGDDSASLYAGYRRHREFDAGDHRGQDWCGARVLGATVVAVVADGVSQSFMGDIAARVVGAGLLDALASEGEAALREPRLAALLEGLRGVADQEVETFNLSSDVPDFLRGALETRRASSGTQTVIAAAIVDLAAGRGRLLLVGDIRVTVHRRGDAPSVVVGDRRGRWSSLHGLRGAVVHQEIDDLHGIVLASDGLPLEFGRDLASIANDAFVEEVVATGADRDDASFVAIIAGTVTPAPGPAAPLLSTPSVPALNEPAGVLAPPVPRTPAAQPEAKRPLTQQGASAPQAHPVSAPIDVAPARPTHRWRRILGLLLVGAGLAATSRMLVRGAATDAPRHAPPPAVTAELTDRPPPSPQKVTTHPIAPPRPSPPAREAQAATHDAALATARDAAFDVSADASAGRRHRHHDGGRSDSVGDTRPPTS